LHDLELFGEAVDEGLGVLGNAPKKMIYTLLERDYGITKEDVPGRFDEFSNLLKDILGPGANPVIRFIVERFYAKLQIQLPTWTEHDEPAKAAHQIVKKLLELSPAEESDLQR
jgi:hypothetical protein